jgi:hypothetical protein
MRSARGNLFISLYLAVDFFDMHSSQMLTSRKSHTATTFVSLIGHSIGHGHNRAVVLVSKRVPLASPETGLQPSWSSSSRVIYGGRIHHEPGARDRVDESVKAIVNSKVSIALKAENSWKGSLVK